MKNYFLEREEILDSLYISLISKQHCFLLGPPGTAKSLMISSICKSIEGAKYFQYLLTKFTTPEEIFGPFSLQELEKGNYLRITKNKLPEAHIVFLDEVFKASSAILNSLLTIMQERIFFNNSDPIKVPLISLFGASNELPQGEELQALYDRFLIRLDVNYISEDSNFIELLKLPDEVKIEKVMTIDDLFQLQENCKKVKISDVIIETILKIKKELLKEGIIASDRRWKLSLNVLKAKAIWENKDEVEIEDLTFLTNCLWSEPQQKRIIVKVITNIASPFESRAIEIYDLAKEIYDNAIKENSPEAGIEANKKIKNLIEELYELKEKHYTKKIEEIFIKVQEFQKEIIKSCLGVEL